MSNIFIQFVLIKTLFELEDFDSDEEVSEDDQPTADASPTSPDGDLDKEDGGLCRTAPGQQNQPEAAFEQHLLLLCCFVLLCEIRV